jgi:KDO2-lipid IV(A) lauroyltransferase
LGKDALQARGPALFSIRTGAPICPMLLRRESFDRHVIITGNPIYPVNSGDEERDIMTMTEAYVRFYEEHIRQYPEQWMWTHRRWKLQTS